jgi:hypothetical protein
VSTGPQGAEGLDAADWVAHDADEVGEILRADVLGLSAA